MKGLEDADILTLLGSVRTRNQYAPKLIEFLNSDEKAIDVKAVWPEFGSKLPSTLYQGFLNAAKKAPEVTDLILVKQHDERVFLLNKERIALVTAAASDATEDSE